MEVSVDGLAGALVREIDLLSIHRGLRVRHAMATILDDDPLRALANHPGNTSANIKEPRPPRIGRRVEEAKPQRRGRVH